MKKRFACMILSLLTCVLSAPRARADEVWTTEEYDVVYQADRERTAVWTYGDNEGTIFIDGLAGVTRDRGAYHGYWVQASSSRRCDTFREGADGEPTYYWGRMDVTFIDPDFPSRWQAKFGLCDQAPVIPLTGTPVTGTSTAVTPMIETPASAVEGD